MRVALFVCVCMRTCLYMCSCVCSCVCVVVYMGRLYNFKHVSGIAWVCVCVSVYV